MSQSKLLPFPAAFVIATLISLNVYAVGRGIQCPAENRQQHLQRLAFERAKSDHWPLKSVTFDNAVSLNSAFSDDATGRAAMIGAAIDAVNILRRSINGSMEIVSIDRAAQSSEIKQKLSENLLKAYINNRIYIGKITWVLIDSRKFETLAIYESHHYKANASSYEILFEPVLDLDDDFRMGAWQSSAEEHLSKIEFPRTYLSCGIWSSPSV